MSQIALYRCSTTVAIRNWWVYKLLFCMTLFLNCLKVQFVSLKISLFFNLKSQIVNKNLGQKCAATNCNTQKEESENIPEIFDCNRLVFLRWWYSGLETFDSIHLQKLDRLLIRISKYSEFLSFSYGDVKSVYKWRRLWDDVRYEKYNWRFFDNV